LSQDQANIIAAELLAKKRQANPSVRARRVPFFMRSPESRQLDRKREWDALVLAQKNVYGGWRTLLGFLVYLALLAALWFSLVSHPVSEWFVLSFMFAIAAPSLVRGALVRRELARLSRAQLTA
jgi:hypothetical protein